MHVICKENIGLLISQGSAAIYLRYGGQCYMSSVATFIAYLAME